MSVQRLGDDLWRAMPDGNEKRSAYYCSREWGLKKEAVKERSGGVCERCGLHDAENVHHKTYIRLYRELLEDLWHLCRGCHEFLHGKNDAKDPLDVKRDELLDKRPLELQFQEGEGYSKSTLVHCPYCNCDCCHMSKPDWHEGNQGLAVFKMYCEGGHEWDMVFEGHKGWLSAWVENGREVLDA